MRVDNGARSGGIIRISLIFYNMEVCCVFSLESPHRGDSNEYTQYTAFNIKKKNHTKLSQICSQETFILGIQEQVPNTPARVAQSVGHLTRKSGVLGSIPGLATYFHFSFRFFKKGSCQLLVKVCARSTG